MKLSNGETMTGYSRPSRWGSDAVRLFVSLFLCVLGLAYASLLAQIGLDTEMRVPLIADAYRGFGPGEFVAHALQYLSWFIVAFGASLGALLATSYSEKIKIFAVIWTPAWIVLDVGGVWLIRYHDAFARLLFVSGLVLALTFLVFFCLVQYDIWLKKGH